MKPFYKTSEFYINLALAVVGAIEGMQGLPGSVTQIAGLAMMSLSAILHTTSRTAVKQATIAAASIVAPLPPVAP